MCRVYGKGKERYARLCYLTGLRGWRLHIGPDFVFLRCVPKAHIRSGEYRLEPPIEDGRSHAPKGFKNG